MADVKLPGAPREEIASPTQIITAPNITVHRTPMRSAMRPITSPPKPTPNQPSDPASAGVERAPRVGGDRLQGDYGDPGCAERKPHGDSETLATTQDCLVSIDVPIMRFPPGPGFSRPGTGRGL